MPHPDDVAPHTTIDPDTGRVDLPLNLSLEWFDLLRGGVVGIVHLVPAECDDMTWTIQYEQVEDVAAAQRARVEAEAEDE